MEIELTVNPKTLKVLGEKSVTQAQAEISWMNHQSPIQKRKIDNLDS